MSILKIYSDSQSWRKACEEVIPERKTDASGETGNEGEDREEAEAVSLGDNKVEENGNLV